MHLKFTPGSRDYYPERLLSIKLLVMVKITAFILFAACLQVSARGAAQSVTLSEKNASLEKVFKAIRKQTGYNFLYNVAWLRQSRKVSIDIKKASLTAVLDSCFVNQPFTYTIIEKTITLKLKALPRERSGLPPPFSVHGIVTDFTTGKPLAGVTIKVKNGSVGVVTDVEGNYSIEVPENAVLVVSYIGYEGEEIPVKGKMVINIQLHPSSTSLNQFVVVGYGTEKKSDLTGSISTVDMNKVANRAAPNLSQVLQGLVPGLTVQRNAGGAPGSSATLRINGFTSVNSSGPLVLIDGIPGTADNIDPNDIASISVLKDASSTAIYGARAAEGVILITTKNGSFSQPLRVSYDANLSLQVPGRFPAENNSVQNAILGNLAFTNSGAAPLYTQQQIGLYTKDSVTAFPNANNTDYIYVANVNWPKIMFHNSLEQSHDLSLSGGSQNISYRISGNLMNQNGTFAGYGPDNFIRKTFRTNLTANLIPSKLKVDVGIDYFNSRDDAPSPGYAYLINIIQTEGANMPIYNPDGTFARYKQQQNPIQLLEQAGFNDTYNDQLTGRLNIAYNITKNLSVKAIGGYLLDYTRGLLWERAYDKNIPTGVANSGYINQPNSVTDNDGYNAYSTGQLLIDYDKIFTGSHHIHFLLGSSVEKEDMSTLTAFRNNIPGNTLPALNIGSNANWTNNSTSGSWAIVSGFSRLNYDYKEKYLLEANVRIDGSSRFSEEHRWGTFPSVSAGWRISSEPFMSDQRIFSDLKLRLSWGETGNQDGLGLYDYIPVYNIGGYYPFGSTLGQWAVSPELASQDRTWETVIIKNVGLDMGFLNNRLSVTADYYEKTNKNMLVNIQVPSEIGITVPTGNYGKLSTKGWDAIIDWKDHLTSDFRYSVSFNIADQQNKLVSTATPFAQPTAGIINLQGYPLNSIFGYQAAGYFQTQDEVKSWASQNPAVNAPGDIKYVDQDHDGKISAPNDLIYLGNTSPRYTFGLNLGLTWKNIDFSAFFQGVGKRDFYLDPTAIAPFLYTYNNYSFAIQNNYWTPGNPNALFPRPYLGSQNYSYSTHWLQNAAYIRLKNLQVGYSLPNDICKKIRAERIRIYFSGEDIWTYTKLLMYDPEMNTTNGEYYPIPEGYSLGLNVTF